MGSDARHTEDGRYVVVDGRRWRATDPSIPDTLRQELVDELMAARRAVRTEGDAARARVGDAKLALGERGEPWWEAPSDDGLAARAAATARALLRHRRPEATICPSDVARIVGGESWRSTMPAVRAVVATMVDAGTVTVTQRGEAVDPRAARGPVRIGRGPSWQ